MRLIGLEEATLETCVRDAQNDRVLIIRDGKPMALIVGVAGMDAEQLELGSSSKFWHLIKERRAQTTLSRTELEQRIGAMQPG